MDKQKVTKLALLIGIVGTIVYLFITASAILKTGNGDNCGWEQITSVGNRGVTNYTYQLDGTHRVGVYLPDWNQDKYNNYELQIRTQATNFHEVSIYGPDNTSVRTFFVKNGSNTDIIRNFNYDPGTILYIDCITCSNNDEVILLQETLGPQQEIVYINHSVQNVEKTNNLYVSLYGAQNCQRLSTVFFWPWVGLLFFVLILIGFAKGFEEAEKVTLKWD